jgi:hypothetical protein
MYDATHENISHLPAGQQALGYVTGSATVQWTAADFAAHPGAVKLDQSPVSTKWDSTADGDDYENSAVTLAELAPRAHERIAAFNAGTRPGQRRPIVYASRVDITNVVNALIAGGISGVADGFGGLGVAEFNNNLIQATAEVVNASGPFPIVWRQYSNLGTIDAGVVSVPWLTTVSGAAPPRTITQPGWRWCHKCQGLFYGPNMPVSHCPAGGTHDGGQSGSYNLQDTIGLWDPLSDGA